ncbi:MAG TPA: hypothetical protein DEP82_19620, partial [Arthrobacter bacterium]|nr:hypothetical protein [Arthrobacter sp.]HCB60045.1 hypothetical protein [Arthrobacter sp.]
RILPAIRAAASSTSVRVIMGKSSFRVGSVGAAFRLSPAWAVLYTTYDGGASVPPSSFVPAALQLGSAVRRRA